MNIFEFWFFLFILGLSLAVPLGPVNLEMIKQVLITKSHSKSFFYAFLTGIGALSGDFIVAFSILSIGSTIFQSLIDDYALRTLLFCFNVLILGYLSLSTLVHSKKIEETVVKETIIDQTTIDTFSLKNDFQKIKNRYITGFAIVVSSPWSYLWWASFGSYIIFGDFNSFDLFQRLLIIACFLSGILAWVIFFPGILSLSKKFASPSFLRIITQLSALVLLAYAINFAFQGLEYLRLWLQL